jgi:hypothetical protein
MATTEIAPFQFPVIEVWNTPVTVEDVLDETLDCFVHYTHVKAHAGEEDLAIRDAHVAASLWAWAWLRQKHVAEFTYSSSAKSTQNFRFVSGGNLLRLRISANFINRWGG